MEEPDEPSRDGELDALRIRQIAQERRACNRARSYALIGGLSCLTATLQLLLMVMRRFTRDGVTWMVIGFSLMIPLCVTVMFFCFKWARQFRLEAQASRLPDPTTPPDFSTLSDGSHRWKDFDRIQ